MSRKLGAIHMHQPLSGPLSLLMVIGDGDCSTSGDGGIYPSDESGLSLIQYIEGIVLFCQLAA